MTHPEDKKKFKESLDDLKDTTSKLWKINTTDPNRPPSKEPSLTEMKANATERVANE